MTNNTDIEVCKKLIKDFQDVSAERERQKVRGLNDYSLINAMLKVKDEVRLHTRFIFSLLDPNGKHYQGTLFLRLFLEIANLTGIIDLQNARVHKEYQDNPKLKGTIDLLITDGERWIAIENKIDARDGKKQLSRYIGYLDKQVKETEVDSPQDSICMVYLSKNPRKPVEDSLGKYSIDSDINMLRDSIHENKPVATYRNLTYREHIKDWLTRCRAEVSNLANLDYAIAEYEIIRQKLCKEYRSKLMKIETVFLDGDIIDENKYKAAMELADKLPTLQAKWLEDAMNGFGGFLEEILADKNKAMTELSENNWSILKGKIYNSGDALKFFKNEKHSSNKGKFFTVELGGEDWVLALLFGRVLIHVGVLPVKKDSSNKFDLDKDRKIKALSEGFKKHEKIQFPFPGLISYVKDLKSHAPELRNFPDSSWGQKIIALIKELDT